MSASLDTVTNTPTHDEFEDVQAHRDTRQLSINKVGIKGIRHPVRVLDRSSGEQHTIAVFNMYVDLPQDFKGTHMSRFVEVLNDHEYGITVQSFKDMLSTMTAALDARSGHIEMTFPYFIRKAAPVTGVKSLLDYEVTLTGEINNDEAGIRTQVVIPVTSDALMSWPFYL